MLILVAFVLPKNTVLAQNPINVERTQQKFVALENSFAPIRLKFRNIKNKLDEAIANKDFANFRQRVEHAEILYLLEDYGRASVVLSEAVRLNGAQSDSHYDKALYFLAESLYQIGNDASAQEYFRDLAQ